MTKETVVSGERHKSATVRYLVGVSALASLIAVPVVVPASAEPAAGSSTGKPIIRRLTAEQYKMSIARIFGADIKFGGRFEQEVRVDGLYALGATKVSVTPTGLEHYDTDARNIARQVIDEAHRNTLLPCKPASETAADDVCATKFFTLVGELLYRRPLTDDEIKTQVDGAALAANTLKSFYDGLSLSFAGMLTSPQFLFDHEAVESDPTHKNAYRLTPYAKASRLSFFLWNSGPDRELLAAAKKGELDTKKGLARQVERLMSSPYIEDGVRAFFTDMLHFDEFELLAKDAEIYPKFTADVTRQAPEQTLKTIVEHLIVRNGDYRDLFTTRNVFMTPLLGSVYSIPVPPRDEIDAREDGWRPFQYAEGDPRAGILSQISFVGLYSHPGRSSPTKRGKALRETLLCQRVPDPPANVDFTLVQQTTSSVYKTARDRVTAHLQNPVCAGCHKITDPIGLALENLDSVGAYRTTENGAPIDASGELDGVKFSDAAGLGKALRNSPALPQCLVNRLYSYGVGHAPRGDEVDFLKELLTDFSNDGYRVPALMQRIAMSDAFYRVSPETKSPAQQSKGDTK